MGEKLRKEYPKRYPTLRGIDLPAIIDASRAKVEQMEIENARRKGRNVEIPKTDGQAGEGSGTPEE